MLKLHTEFRENQHFDRIVSLIDVLSSDVPNLRRPEMMERRIKQIQSLKKELDRLEKRHQDRLETIKDKMRNTAWTPDSLYSANGWSENLYP